MATERQTYWQGVIQKQANSGLTKIEFFKLNNINPATYYYSYSQLCRHYKEWASKLQPLMRQVKSYLSIIVGQHFNLLTLILVNVGAHKFLSRIGQVNCRLIASCRYINGMN